MTRDEIKKILITIDSLFPSYRIENLSFTIDAWSVMLEEYSYPEISQALKTFVATENKGFAPSVGQLIALTNRHEELSEMNEVEAWGYVAKALKDSTYHSQERFLELPELVQRSVGCHENLRDMAMSEDTNLEVEKSNFMRVYRMELQRKSELSRMPSDVKALVQRTVLALPSAKKEEDFMPRPSQPETQEKYQAWRESYDKLIRELGGDV